MKIYNTTKGVAMKTMCISKIILIIIGFLVLTSYSGQWEVFTNKNDVRDIALAGNTLWAATTGGVVAWNLADTTYTSYTTADGLLSANINHVSIDKKGRPWIATKDPVGLFVYENRAWEQMKIGGANTEDVERIISDLEVDRYGNVWVYTANDNMYLVDDRYLWRYDGRTWHKHENEKGPLALDLQKNLLAVDSLSIFNSEGDLDRLQFRIVSFNNTEFVSEWRSEVGASVDAEHGYIALAHIAIDSKGNPWISYYGERSGKIYGIVGNSTLYTTLDGLAGDNVRSITADGSGAV
jgi:hypothetical protein